MTQRLAVYCDMCGHIVYSRAHYDCRFCPCSRGMGGVFIDGGAGEGYLRTNACEFLRLELDASERELYNDWNFGGEQYGLVQASRHPIDLEAGKGRWPGGRVLGWTGSRKGGASETEEVAQVSEKEHEQGGEQEKGNRKAPNETTLAEAIVEASDGDMDSIVHFAANLLALALTQKKKDLG